MTGVQTCALPISIQKKTFADKNKYNKIFRLFQEALKQLRHIVANENTNGVFESSVALEYDFSKSELTQKLFHSCSTVSQKAMEILIKYSKNLNLKKHLSLDGKYIVLSYKSLQLLSLSFYNTA